MATARELVTDAYQDAEVLALDVDPSAEEAADGLRRLNQMISALDLDGIPLGVASYGLDDTINVPDSFVRPLRKMLAVELAAAAGLTIPQMAAIDAERGKRALRAQFAQVRESTVDRGLQVSRYEYGWRR